MFHCRMAETATMSLIRAKARYRGSDDAVVAGAALLLSVMAQPTASWDGVGRVSQDLPRRLRIGVPTGQSI
jgi:hypothetical protein